MLKKIENEPHEKDAKTPRAALLLLDQAPKQRGGKDCLKNKDEGGHNGYGYLIGNNLTYILSKNLALFLTH